MTDSDRTRSYLVECYWPGVSEEVVLDAARRTRDATSELRRQGREIDFVASILIHEDETVFSLFRGSEADVRAASARAGLPFERVLRSLRIDGGKRVEEGDRQ
jgi:hypothetical protein